MARPAAAPTPPRLRKKPTGGGAAILLAAGGGARMRGVVPDKVLAPLAGQPVFAHSLAAFADAGVVSRLVVVYRDAPQRARLARVLVRSAARDLPVTWVRGGAERQDSVANALEKLARIGGVERVFIHDCARPLLRAATLRALDGLVRRDGAAALAHRVVDTIKQAPVNAARTPERSRLRGLDRARLWAMETPQAFHFPTIAAAYAEVRRAGLKITDDIAALEAASKHGVTLLENPDPNPKITHPADLAWVRFLVEQADGRDP